jgi:hypothetical protein
MEHNYEPGTDALFIKLVEKKHNVRTVNLSDEIKPDFTTGELSLAIEILETKEANQTASTHHHI